MYSKSLGGLACAAVLSVCAFGPIATAGATVRDARAHSAATYTITEAGSTLVLPIMAYWATAWDKSSGNTVSYNGGGSGAGESEVGAGQIDIGASDAPLSAYPSGSCTGCVQIPWALTATGISFNINNGQVKSLHLTGAVIAKIYLGKIKYWNNSAIKALNPHTNLPHLAIVPYHRSDASGDSFAFTKYESEVSPAFQSGIGASTQPTFPVGPGVSGNGAMASSVQSQNGAIAYVAVSYLINDGLPAASIKNRAGRFEVPNLSEIENATCAIHHVPSNNQLIIVNPPRGCRSAYVISTFTYAMLPKTGSRNGGVPAAPIKQFIYYAVHGGQQFAAQLDFAHLPGIVVTAATNTLKTVH